MSVSTGMIIFQIINKYIPDLINQYSGRFSSEQLKFAISALVISAPIYYLTTQQIYKNLFSGKLEEDSGVRKWLTYFILLVTSIVMISWLIGVINNFLDGEFTLKFILKAITALGISAIIFTFYLHDIKRENIVRKKDNIIKIYFYCSLILVITAFAYSLFTVESPTETRNRKFDEAIINDFNTITSAIDNYYSNNSKLPANIEELKEDSSYLFIKDLKDPESKEDYEYKLINDKEYELCATFKTSNKESEEKEYMDYYERFYSHDTGYQCLKNKVNQQSQKTIPERIPAEIME
jgi:hypothetical protein